MEPAQPIQSNHRIPAATQLVIAAILILLTAVAYGTTLMRMADQWWSDPASSYGLLIPPLALYTAWHFRARTLSVPAKGDSRGLLVIALACVALVIALGGDQSYLARLSFVILLAGITWTFWGVLRLKTLAFPFVLLVTAIPLPEFIIGHTLPLQLFASSMATNIIQFFGGTVHREGNIIELANLRLSVEEACSGLNSLTSLGVAALLVGFIYCVRPLSRTILLVISLPLAIAANVLRVTGTAVLANYREELAMGFYHLFSGWLIFILSCGALMLIARALSRSLERYPA